LLVAGCTKTGTGSAKSGTGSQHPSAGASSPATVARPTAWQRVLGEIGPDGQISTATALRAFALAFGPLPGVTVPGGEVGVIRSGSGALRWLVNHWTEITAAQRSAAIRLVPELVGLASGPAPSASVGSSLVAAAPTHPASYYTAIAKSTAAEITKHVDVVLGLDLKASEAAVQPTSAAETEVSNAAGGFRGGAAAKCVIKISAAGAAYPPDDFQNLIAHEVWHCFQGQVLGVDAYWSRQSWIVEGEAEWVGDTLSPGSRPDTQWTPYVLEPGARLFSRTYDAIGFFSHLDEAQLDTWHRLIPVLDASADNVAAFNAAGAASDAFLDSWASGYFREPLYGKAWDMTGPGLPAETVPVRPVLTVVDGKVSNYSAPAFANSVFALSSTADVLVFAATGHVRLADTANKQEYVISGASMFCTKSGGCECPPGTSFAGVPPNPLSPESALAASSGADATSGTATGLSLDEFCKGGGKGAAWHFDAPSRYSGGAAHTVVDAYTCGSLRGPWHATLHVTHGPATSSDPPLDRMVNFSWSFDRDGNAVPTIGPYGDTVFGRAHTIIYFPHIHLDPAKATITVVSMQGSEDGGPHVNVTYQLDRIGEAVPVQVGKPPEC